MSQESMQPDRDPGRPVGCAVAFVLAVCLIVVVIVGSFATCEMPHIGGPSLPDDIPTGTVSAPLGD